jgi:hypothetical protein
MEQRSRINSHKFPPSEPPWFHLVFFRFVTDKVSDENQTADCRLPPVGVALTLLFF